MFHPKCVDEWLQKWNRVCPLCKLSITRGRQNRSDEQSQLLVQQENGRYGSLESSGGTSSLEEEEEEEERDGVTGQRRNTETI